MSYEPRLIISKLDLEKSRAKIEKDIIDIEIKPPASEKGKQRAKVVKEVFEALNEFPIEFLGKKLVIIQPELTSHNKQVRQYLIDNNIRFTTSN